MILLLIILLLVILLQLQISKHSNTIPKLSVYMFASPTRLMQPTISGCPALRGFLEYGVFSVKTKLVPGNQVDWPQSPSLDHK